MSNSIVKISPALLAIQKEIKNTKQTAENPFYHSTYTPLNEMINDLRKIYNAHGITIMQDIEGNNVSVLLLHESGEWIQQEGMSLPIERQSPQGAGSAVTYGRRYTLSAMAGIASEEDDDGNKSETESNTIQEKAAAKLKALPENVKEGFKILGYKSNIVWQICNDFKWDNDKILAELNKRVDGQVPQTQAAGL